MPEAGRLEDVDLVDGVPPAKIEIIRHWPKGCPVNARKQRIEGVSPKRTNKARSIVRGKLR